MIETDPRYITLHDPHALTSIDVRQGRRGSRTFLVLIISLLLGAVAVASLIIWSTAASNQIAQQQTQAIETNRVTP